MGLADWDEGDFEKSMKKETSKYALKKPIRQYIKEKYFKNNSIKLLKVAVKDNLCFDVTYNDVFIINGSYNIEPNIDSSKYVDVPKDFVDRVKNVCNDKVLPSLKKLDFLPRGILAFLLSGIPIRFGKQGGYDCDDSQYLGLYRRIYKNNEREIILFEDAIKSEAKEDEEYLDNLIWKVIIHEYAHAIMDTIFHNENKLKEQDHKLYKYREESLANAFALKVLKGEMGDSYEFKKILKFVEKQSEEYRHGLALYERDDLLKMMEFWRETKIIGNKSF